MQANCSDPTTVAMAPPHPEGEHQVAHFVYQSATVLAILLFLISFWGC
jgi:hypothetical protein